MPWRSRNPLHFQMAGDAVCMAIFSVDMILRSQFWGRELLMKNWFRGQLVVVVLTSLDLISRDMTRLQWTGPRRL